jgi:CheY-like chemotaxis protein
MHQGTIEVSSRAGEGSTFSVMLHYEPAPEDWDPKLERNDRTLVSGRGSAILLVDDNAVNQKLVSSILRKEGYRVEIRSNGEEAIEALQKQAFHLVLMDLQMPVLDGLTATRRIRTNPDWKNLPIIAMTAHAMHGDQDICIAAGMNGYISKPVHSAHLLSMVEDYCGASVRKPN